MTPAGPMGAGYAPRISFTRETTSKRRLKVRWDYPVYKKEVKSENDTVALSVDRALPRDEAFAYLAGKDRRPMLVMRECHSCVGTEAALFNNSQDNDKTMLFAKWFHNVKLPPDVMRDDHPFRNVFPPASEPCHLFLASADGSNYVPLSGAQSQSDLWTAMQDLLRKEYENDPERAVDDLMKLLTQYDRLDGLLRGLEERFDNELEKRGPKSPKLRRLNKEKTKLEKEKDSALAKDKKVSDLKLKPKKQKEAAL